LHRGGTVAGRDARTFFIAYGPYTVFAPSMSARHEYTIGATSVGASRCVFTMAFSRAEALIRTAYSVPSARPGSAPRSMTLERPG
jgi:hypothetical protein